MVGEDDRIFDAHFNEATRGRNVNATWEQDGRGTAREQEEGAGPNIERWELLPELLDGGQGKSVHEVGTRDLRDNGREEAQPTSVLWTPPAGEPPDGGTMWGGLNPPTLHSSGELVTGATKEALRRQNKRQRQVCLERQQATTTWTKHLGAVTPVILDYDDEVSPSGQRRQMCPQRLAMEHPAGPLLNEWSQYGCPAMTGKEWTREQMEAAVARGPHESAMTAEAIAHFREEVRSKVAAGQARVVAWEDIKSNPPRLLKISPVAAIPHKSKAYRSILDLSFRLRLADGGIIPSVNETTTKTAPEGAIDQIGHSLKRIIHAFADTEDDAVIFMAKWDIKDGFWRLQCKEGEEWNFAYVLPQEEGSRVQLVVPTSLQMGWIESPPYFCAASETARDVAAQYIETTVGSLPDHKFVGRTEQAGDERVGGGDSNDERARFRYLLEVYVDDFMSLVIPTSPHQLRHVANAVMRGIHDVFAPDDDDDNDPISFKKLEKGEGRYSTRKCILGFDFDGREKTLWLEEEKRAMLLTILHGWIRGDTKAHAGIPFKEFESVVAKLRHAFTAIPAGKGLLSPCNWVLREQPSIVFLHRNKPLREAITDARVLLRESTSAPTRCRELVAGWPDFIGVVDASGQGVGGVVIGENLACTPTVFRMEWPDDIKAELVSWSNRTGSITNSDLEMAGLLLLWLVMEGVCGNLQERRVALFSDNDPTVRWTKRMASRHSRVAAQLIRAITLRMKVRRACPITPVHIPGVENSMTDIPSRSFGSVAEWHCKTNTELLTLFNSRFPLPVQGSWTVYQLTSKICTRVISVLWMKDISMDEWRRLPKLGRHDGNIGAPTSRLWDWTLTFRGSGTSQGSECLQALQHGYGGDVMDEGSASRLQRSLAQSQPLARRSPWPSKSIQQK